MPGSSSVVVVRALVATAAPGDPRGMLDELGVAPELAADDEARVPFETMVRAWEVAERRSGDVDFGLHFGERVRVGAFSVLDYTMRSSPSLGEALRRLVRYQRLFHEAVKFELIVDGEVARITHRVVGDPRGAPRQAAEAALAVCVVRARWLIGEEIVPREVRFQHAAPARLDEHRRIFRAPIKFGAEVNQVELDAGLLERRVPSSDPGLCAVLDRHAEAVLARLPSSEGVIERLRVALSEALRGGEPTLAAMAARLRMSGRTLQRALGREGTSFQGLLDGMRRDLAARYLSEREVALGEVAYLLGFSEPSAFHRAFRRWEGMTPQEFRRNGRSRQIEQ